MGPNPLIGVLYHWIGGLASASNFIPFKGIRKWAWEVYWLIQGVFSWIIAPSFMAWLLVPDVFAILHATSPHVLGMTWFWGVLWGFGGLTFGLTIRYLGIALGYAIALGLCTVFGTLMPPLFSGQLAQIASEHSGQVILFGLFVCVVGIVINAAAGVRKQGELSDEKKKETVLEFSFTKGLLVAVFSGIMSSCFAYGLASGKPIAAVTRAHLVQNGRLDLWQGLPVLIVVTLGGFTTNLIWCAFLILRNKRLGEFIGRIPALPMPARSLGAAAAPVPPATLISDAQTRQSTRRKRNTRNSKTSTSSAPTAATRASHSSATTSTQALPASSGTSSFFSTAWARPRWGSTISPAGPCTWPASSSSPPSGASPSKSGMAPRAARRSSSASVCSCSSSRPSSSATATTLKQELLLERTSSGPDYH